MRRRSAMIDLCALTLPENVHRPRSDCSTSLVSEHTDSSNMENSPHMHDGHDARIPVHVMSKWKRLVVSPARIIIQDT